MTDNSEIIITEFAILPCSEIVYRALMKKKWIDEDTGRIRPDAFFLRKHREETGLSVKSAHQKIVLSDSNVRLSPVYILEMYEIWV